jgi:hypothetical protein
VILEIYMKSNLDRFSSYGWVTNNQIESIVEDCEINNGTLGVFGDSFVEYYKNSKANLVSQLSFLSHHKNACNFGLSGTGMNVYLNRFKYSVERLNLNKAIIFLYEGNDFFELNKPQYSKSATEFDRNNRLVYSTLKKFASINFIYRKIIKPITKREVNFHDYNFQYCPRPKIESIESKIQSMQKNSPAIYKNFANNKLNIAWLNVALNCPDYFGILADDSNHLNNTFPVVKSYIKEFLLIAESNNVDLSMVIIPHDYFVSNENKSDWENVFLFNRSKYLGPTPISLKLIQEFDFIHYAKILKNNDFIDFDGHLLPSGAKKLANFTVNRTLKNTKLRNLN